ncbi:MAG: ferritin-like domain-containing protein, partial [Verrucomicrobiae bacterium]|nr:ferritin-like domain-containing protein [Verrucomicrobiae bacterium]NNJ86557.1 DUF3182 family protein [Akkermansiaceae bacterium]
VGHGVKWFRKWKKQGETDWHAFNKSLTFPLSPAKAKGMAPFNAEGRRLAGFDQDFIDHLEVCEQSRGRTPVVHWFNPNAESHVAAALTGKAFQPNAMESAIEQDLEMLMLAWCRRDNIALMRKLPGNEHLAYLKRRGFDLPEIIQVGQLADRKLGGLRPWAWSPDASETLRDFASDISPNLPWQWRASLPSLWFSKECGVRLSEKLGLVDGCGRYCPDASSAADAVCELLTSGDVLIKAAHACAGRGHKRVKAGDDYRPWLEKTIHSHGGVVVEPWLDRVLDFSAQYEIRGGQTIDFIGMTEIVNDAQGRFLGTRVYPKWGTGLDPKVAEFLFREAKINEWYRSKIPSAVVELLHDYIGPVGVDAMVYRRSDGTLALRHIIELNVRMTMGRVALELHKKTAPAKPGQLQVLRKKQLSKDQLLTVYSQDVHSSSTVINNPKTASEFIAVWSESV